MRNNKGPVTLPGLRTQMKKEQPIVRQKLMTSPTAGRFSVPFHFVRDKVLERSHIIGVRMMTIETLARINDPKANPLPTVAEVAELRVTFVDRHGNNVYDGGPCAKFIMNTTLVASAQDHRQLFVPVRWQGLDLRLSFIRNDGANRSVAFQFFYIERQDLE